MSVIRAVCEPLLIVYEHCIFPDAGRVAPISASVLCLRFVLAFCAGVLCWRLVLAFDGSGTFTILQKLYCRVSYILHKYVTIH